MTETTAESYQFYNQQRLRQLLWLFLSSEGSPYVLLSAMNSTDIYSSCILWSSYDLPEQTI